MTHCDTIGYEMIICLNLLNGHSSTYFQMMTQLNILESGLANFSYASTGMILVKSSTPADFTQTLNLPERAHNLRLYFP